jgi:pyridoxine 5-phosphate synthase
MPNLLEVTKDLQRYGAQGITVHPRPDQRHIRYEDVRSLPEVLTTEFNIEGNPIPKFVDLVMKVKPAQVTLVPDAVDALTSNAGWDTIKNQDFFKRNHKKKFQSEGIRTSIFIDPVLDQIEGAAATGTDRIELYTEAYAADYTRNREIAIAPYVAASERANELGLGINAGHDLNLDNIAYFAKRIPSLLEVSIGHALICESLYLGFENVIPMYLQRLSY